MFAEADWSVRRPVVLPPSEVDARPSAARRGANRSATAGLSPLKVNTGRIGRRLESADAGARA